MSSVLPKNDYELFIAEVKRVYDAVLSITTTYNAIDSTFYTKISNTDVPEVEISMGKACYDTDTHFSETSNDFFILNSPLKSLMSSLNTAIKSAKDADLSSNTIYTATNKTLYSYLEENGVEHTVAYNNMFYALTGVYLNCVNVLAPTSTNMFVSEFILGSDSSSDSSSSPIGEWVNTVGTKMYSGRTSYSASAKAINSNYAPAIISITYTKGTDSGITEAVISGKDRNNAVITTTLNAEALEAGVAVSTNKFVEITGIEVTGTPVEGDKFVIKNVVS